MKKLFMLAATAAIALSSCSENEITEIATPNENPNVIGLSIGSFATKAETTTTTLNTEDNIIKIYSTDSDFASSGNIEFKYDDTSTWASTADDAETWENADFPLYLYSLNTGVKASGNLVVTPTTGSAAAAATATYTPAAVTNAETPVDQNDLVYYGSRLAMIPTNGNISATFKHALSRIMMQVKAADGYNIYIANVKLVNVIGTDTPTISVDDASASSIAWANEGKTASSNSYSVTYNHYYDVDATLDDVSTTESAVEGYVYTFTDATAQDLATAAGSNKDMYIIPQTSPAYDTSAIKGTHVEVTCCMYIGTTPVLGYRTGSEHIEYNATDEDWLALEDTPLYVKLAFPVNEVTLNDGTYYNFVLDFTGADIEIAEDGYVDDEGEGVEDFPADATEPSTEDDVNVDSETAISLTVTAIAWPDDADATAEELGEPETEEDGQ